MNLTFAAVTGSYEAAFKKMYEPIARAATGAIKDAESEILQRGRANIAGAGFSSRWQRGLRTRVTPQNGNSVDAAVRIYHTRGFATVFETGAVIRGKPLLWLPLPTLPDRVGGRPLTPKVFVRTIGPLFTMKGTHRPMLGAYMQGVAGSKVTMAKLRRGSALSRLGVRGRGGQARASKGLVATPVFIGVDQVSLRRRWNLTGVYDTARANLAANFARRMRAETR